MGGYHGSLRERSARHAPPTDAPAIDESAFPAIDSDSSPGVGDAIERALIAELNATRISPRDLALAAEALGNLPEGLRTWPARRARLARMFPDQPRRVEAIDFRIRAMVDVVGGPHFRAWTDPAPDGESAATLAPLWKAAAREPLIWDVGGAALGFQPGAFLRRVLRLSPTRGTG